MNKCTCTTTTTYWYRIFSGPKIDGNSKCQIKGFISYLDMTLDTFEYSLF